ncbi:MAG: response regulator [Actinobacteria bacterium]|nr:response regulator [Actinomycetota bacterium]NIS35558.1 response regulator [Actinomycetota bacterium]NIT98295.1 response regulator [Actinomycetota bacterium]NIU21825.1 response regulator [Actinomycetota bacterium]NIU70217.1 response regulator [Actinomycetota bacterium]
MTTDPVRVVVAEDEAIIRLDLVETLRAEGYDVVADTGRGDEAVALVAQHGPDVALLDIKMPGLDGIEAARRITAERNTAVVILSAFSQRELIEQATEAGAMTYLVKPYQRGDLVPAIETALARFREFRSLEDQVGELSDRLAVRKLVDRAKGRLMDDHAMAEQDAFRWLQQQAMDGRRRLAEVAEAVIDGTLSP